LGCRVRLPLSGQAGCGPCSYGGGLLRDVYN
jgi:hypothetical protein